jgi:hypothetical protein
MIMADILQILLLILGGIIIVVCYWLLFEALAPILRNHAKQVKPSELFPGFELTPVAMFG